MKRRYLLLFFACFFAFVGAFAQHENNVQTVRGTVVDETTQYPLVGALVGVVDYPELSAISNEQGEFVIYDVPLGRQSFEITYVGYKTERIENVLLVSGKETHLNVALEENVVVTERVVVTARKVQPESLNEMATVSARAISVEQTERFAGSLGDPARMVANYAGVSSKDDSRNDIIIRGNSPIGVLWRLDGVEIPNPNHFATLGATGGPVGMINNNLLATSDFLIGAFPAEYGNATAGVFDLHLRPGNTFTHEFVGQVGFNGFEFGAEGPLSTDKNIRPSYLINFRYSTLEVMNMLGMDFGTGAAIPEYKDVTYNITIPTENKGLFKVFGLWGDSFIQLGREENAESNSYNAQGTATDFGSETGVFAGSHTYFFNKNMRLRSTASFQYTTVNTDFDSASNSGVYKPMFRQRQYQTKVSVHQKLISKISSALTFSAGYVYDMIDVDYIDSTFQGSETGFVTGIDIQEPMNLVQSYIQAQYKPLRNIKIYAGAHSQYFDVNSQMVIEPRAGIEFYLPHSQYIKLGYGVHNQTQIPEIYFLRKYDAQQQLYEYTNKNVKFTRNNHYVVSYGISFLDYWRVQSEFYYQELLNVPVSAQFPEYSFINSGAEFYVFDIHNLENTGTGSNVGVELTVERRINKGYYVLLTSSIFESTYIDYNGVTRNTAFNTNYNSNILVGYEFNINEELMFTCDIRTAMSGGKPYIPIDLEASIEKGQTVYNADLLYEKRYDSYFRTDIRLGLKQNGKKFSQEWGLDLQNVSNHKNIFHQEFDARNEEILPVYQQGFMPMMLYRIRF